MLAASCFTAAASAAALLPAAAPPPASVSADLAAALSAAAFSAASAAAAFCAASCERSRMRSRSASLGGSPAWLDRMRSAPKLSMDSSSEVLRLSSCCACSSRQGEEAVRHKHSNKRSAAATSQAELSGSTCKTWEAGMLTQLRNSTQPFSYHTTRCACAAVMQVRQIDSRSPFNPCPRSPAPCCPC